LSDCEELVWVTHRRWWLFHRFSGKSNG